MVKLLRLTTSNEKTANFDNNFNADIVIPPNGRIALLNIALDTLNSEIIINNSNNILSYQITANGDIIEIELENGAYDKISYVNLLQDIETKLNESLLYLDGGDRNLIGLQWRARVVDKRVNIEYDRGILALHEDNFVNNDDVEFQDDSGIPDVLAVWGEPTLITTDVRDVAMFQTYLSKGIGVLRCQLGRLEPHTGPSGFLDNGVIIGLSKTDLTNISPEDFDVNDISYGLKASANTNGYNRYFTYTPTAREIPTSTTSRPVTNGDYDPTNDFMEIQINGGNIVIGAYKNIENEFVEYLNTPYNQNDNLYPFICFHTGSDYTTVFNIQVTPTPYVVKSNHDKAQLSLGIDPPEPNDPITNGEALLNFDNSDVSRFLGYDTSQQGPYIANIYNFIAQDVLASADIPDNFLVELLSLNIDSYDGLREQRKNILYSLAVNDDFGSIHYETPNLLYIDLLNTFELRIRNIRARIVKSDYTPIPILSQGYMTLILE